MARKTRIKTGWMTFVNKQTSTTFWPATDWMDAKQVGKLMSNFEVCCLEGDQQVSAAYQVADVENSPGTSYALGSYASTNVMTYGASFTDVSANTQPKQLVRLGFLVKNTATTNPTWTRVNGYFDILDMQ